MQVAASMLLILCLCNCMFFGSVKTSKGMFSLDNKYSSNSRCHPRNHIFYQMNFIYRNIEIDLLIKRISNYLLILFIYF